MMDKTEITGMVDSLVHALNDDVRKKTVKRIVIQDFILGLNRRNYLNNDETTQLMKYALNRIDG